MYPEEGGAAPEAGGGGNFKYAVTHNLEGLIPVILILVIGFFLAVQFDVITSNTPVVGMVADLIKGKSQPASMLIIGATSQDVITILDDSRDLVHYRIMDPSMLERNPKEQLAYYDIVMLDQSEQANKSVSRELGEAIEAYVKRGGKLIVVLDSGITRPGAPDVAGWANTFGSVVPVSCDRVINNQPVCMNRISVMGKIYREDEEHPIMSGIPVAPADPAVNEYFTVLDVGTDGKEIAYIEDLGPVKKQYPAIVEKKLVIGKSIYFNYNPGTTRGIFESTIRYLK